MHHFGTALRTYYLGRPRRQIIEEVIEGDICIFFRHRPTLHLSAKEN